MHFPEISNFPRLWITKKLLISFKKLFALYLAVIEELFIKLDILKINQISMPPICEFMYRSLNNILPNKCIP